jgi:hypothetical protein
VDICKETGMAFFELSAEFPSLVGYWHFRLGIVIIEKDTAKTNSARSILYHIHDSL